MEMKGPIYITLNYNSQTSHTHSLMSRWMDAGGQLDRQNFMNFLWTGKRQNWWYEKKNKERDHVGQKIEKKKRLFMLLSPPPCFWICINVIGAYCCLIKSPTIFSHNVIKKTRSYTIPAKLSHFSSIHPIMPRLQTTETKLQTFLHYPYSTATDLIFAILSQC